jgi:hypothetical protein
LNTEPALPQPAEPALLQPLESALPQPAEPALLQPLESALPQPAEPALLQPVEPALLQPVESALLQPVESALPQPAELAHYIVEPKRTYALVVGIEKYGETAWDVKNSGAVKDALNFTSWLCERGVPIENICLCLSSIEENRHLVEQSKVKVELATEQNIYHIITTILSQQQGDLLFIFWSGHSLTTLERERVLICANDRKQDYNSLNLNSLLLLLASDAFKIPKHICIVDVDTNYFSKSQRQANKLVQRKLTLGKPRQNSQQFVLFNLRELKQDNIRLKNKIWYFFQSLMEAFEQEHNNFLPPNMEVIAERIKQQFKGLDKKEMPSYYYCRRWNGHIEVFYRLYYKN